MVAAAAGLNDRELQLYVQRIGDRWALQRALLGGARVQDAQGMPPSASAAPST